MSECLYYNGPVHTNTIIVTKISRILLHSLAPGDRDVLAANSVHPLSPSHELQTSSDVQSRPQQMRGLAGPQYRDSHSPPVPDNKFSSQTPIAMVASF